MRRKIAEICLALLLPVLIYALFCILSPENFASASVLQTVLIQSFIPLLCAFGMVFGRSMKMLDLSIGSRIIASSIMAGVLTQQFGLGVPALVLFTLVISVILGAICGVIFHFCRIPSIVVSLVTAMVFEVIGFSITGGAGYLKLERELAILGRTPYNFIVVLVSAALFYVIYYKTKFCYNVRAISGDELIAKSNGIKVMRTKFLAYVVGSIFIGIAAVMQLSYATSMSGKLSMESLSMSFKPLMAMIIGIQLQDYITLPIGIFAGSFMISTLFSGLVALGFSAPSQDIAMGLFLVIVLSISTNSDCVIAALKRRKQAA